MSTHILGLQNIHYIFLTLDMHSCVWQPSQIPSKSTTLITSALNSLYVARWDNFRWILTPSIPSYVCVVYFYTLIAVNKQQYLLCLTDLGYLDTCFFIFLEIFLNFFFKNLIQKQCKFGYWFSPSYLNKTLLNVQNQQEKHGFPFSLLKHIISKIGFVDRK